MRRIEKLAAAAAVLAAGLAIFGSSAGAAPSATDQSGTRQFAGPPSMCPGSGWDCVGPSAFPVAQDGNQNVIVCVGASLASCATSTQNGEWNKIECTDELKGAAAAMAVQTCGPFTQTGGVNEAIYKLSVQTSTGSTQCAVQTGAITQTGVTNKFKAQFRVSQEARTGSAQIQGARQSIEAVQGASEKNESDVEETQIQKASGNASSQLQNTGNAACGSLPPDCAQDSPGPTTPFTCLNLAQSIPPSGGSDNVSKLLQNVKQEATTRAANATQTQGSFSGGNDAQIHQSAPGDGKNVNVVDQKTEQKLSGPSSANQDQFEDPGCCGVGSQDGGTNNEETINQTVKQQASDEDAFQHASAKGVARTPTGGCRINHDLENNSDSAEESRTAEPCFGLILVTECTSGGGDGPSVLQEGEGCFTPVDEPCEEGEEPDFSEGLDCVEVYPEYASLYAPGVSYRLRR